MIAIVTDSASDIPADLAERHNITVVPAIINVGQDTYRDGVDMTREQFYEQLPSMHPHPMTSAPSPAAFLEAYERTLGRAKQVLSLHLSSKLSGIYNVARLAAEQLAPARIHVLDTGQLSMGVGWVSLLAAEMSERGESIEAMIHSVQDSLSRIHTYALLNTVEYVARSGRINLVQAGISTILNIKPMVEVREGVLASLERVRTWSRAVASLRDRVRELAPLECLAVMHTNAKDAAQELMDQFKELVPHPKKSVVTDATPAIGVHAGPGALGISAILSRKNN